MILALDLGSSSVRALVFASPEPGREPGPGTGPGAGTTVGPGTGPAVERAPVPRAPVPRAQARRRVRQLPGPDGAAELDPREHLDLLAACLDELHERGALDGVRVVASAVQWHSLVGLNRRGEPVTPLVTWADTRGGPPGRRDGVDLAALHQRTGAWPHRLYWTGRVPWLRERVGPGLHAVAGLPELLCGQFLGDASASLSCASGTGLLDLRTGDWDPVGCELAGVGPAAGSLARAGAGPAVRLPALAGPGWTGRLTPHWARRWPALREVPWTAPVGDGAAAAVAAAASAAGDAGHAGPVISVTVGTSAAVRVATSAPLGAPLAPLPEALWRHRVDEARVVTGVAYSDGGNVFRWARDTLRLPDEPELSRQLSMMDPRSLRVRVDGVFGGDRPPGTRPAGSARMSGLGFATTPVEILAALLTAGCRRVGRGVAELESTLDIVAGPADHATGSTPVVLGGGALAASPWWRAAFTTVLARQVCWQPLAEASAWGAALIAVGR